ncbi:hypothetical protein DMENIID0001_167920 [Sergentomyia squamirostris]
MKIFSVFLFILAISASSGSAGSTEDVCLCCGVNIMTQSMDNCIMAATPVTSQDMKMLKKLCEIDTKVAIATKYHRYFDRLPYLGVRGWTLDYLHDFTAENCQHEMEKNSGTLFWLTKVSYDDLPDGYTGYYLGRKIMYTGTREVITQLGMIEMAYLDYQIIHPIHLDGYPDISEFPGSMQYLVRRIPISYEVTNPVKLNQSSFDIQDEHIGDFTYHNPSQYPQKFAVEVEFPVDVTYETDEYLFPRTPLEYRGPNETVRLQTGEYFTETLNYTITFNVTVQPRHTVAARVWGVWTRFETVFNATLNTTFVKLGSFIDYNVKTNVTGKKINVRFGRFYLADIHQFHSNEVLIVSYSTISAILFAFAFLMALVALFHVIRNIRKCCEKKKIDQEGYTVLDNESTVNPTS